MNQSDIQAGRRILVIDDNRAIHRDFRKILSSDLQSDTRLQERESVLFGDPAPACPRQHFQIDSAYDGEEGLRLLSQAVESGERYSVAFVDVRMGSGLDGVETTAKLWEIDADLQVVICTAHSDYSWDDTVAKLGYSDRLVILKKPFDNVEVEQLANALTQKWRLHQQARIKLDELEAMVGVRTEQLLSTNARLQAEIAERKDVEAALRHVAEGISATTGEEFFRSLVKSLAQALGTDYAYVAEQTGPDRKRIRTIALCADRNLVESREFDLARSPAEQILREKLVCCPEGIRNQFPDDRWLAELNIEGFIGAPLFDATGRATGLVAVMNRKPLQKPDLTRSMLQIYSLRAATELERKRTEQALRQQLDRISLLNQITRAIAERQGMESNFKVTLDFLEERLAVDFSRVYAWDAPGTDLALITHGAKGGTLAAERAEDKNIPVAQSGLQGCLNGQVVYQPDVRQNPAPLFQSLARSGIGSVLATPLSVENRVFGILVVGRQAMSGFSEAEAEFLRTVSEHISLAAHHARLHSDLQSAYDKLQHSQQAIMQQERLAAVGQLSAGIAHDFNNILCIILGYTTMLQDEGGDLSQKHADALKQISTATQRAADLTRQLLTFSRKQVMQPRTLEFNEVIGDVSRMLQRLVGEDIIVQFHFSPKPVYLHADLGMIEQIVVNLAVNARDAMARGGQLILGASAVEIDEAYRRRNPEAYAGSFACLSVSDSGCGIPPEELLRIFEPFFTTKPVGKGTGLGLSTVYGIVKQHNGWIEVTSEVGRGTTFKIFLPRCPEPGAVNDSDTTFYILPRWGNEKVLLVEDEAGLRGLAGKLLRKQGYEIHEAATGAEALEVWEQQAGAFDLLLTDMVMPGGMNGRELAERLIGEKPELKVIFTSGYSTEMVGNNFVLEEEVNFLPKPYPPKALIYIVRACLDGDMKNPVATHA
jgi:signal transduction histidine kinase/response regulator RpfG family c-di-GMP phosphodiesterase